MYGGSIRRENALRRLDTALVALLSAVPPMLALACVGIIVTPDTMSYVAYAEALRNLPLPQGEDLLRSGAMPATLFRTIGFPALLVALQAVSPVGWAALLVALQVVAQSLVAAVAHRAGLALGLGRGAAAAAALMPAMGFAVVAQVSVMTDALYGALASLAALTLVFAAVDGRAVGRVALAGLLLGLATLLREATVYLVLAFLPAAVTAMPRRPVMALALLLLPTGLAAGGMVALNQARSGKPVLTTTRQIVMVQALLPLVKRDVPVFDGEDAFDRAARRFVVPQGYEGIAPMLEALHAEEGLTAPQLAALATARYWRAWRRHPAEMLRGMMVRFPARFLAAPFQPVDSIVQVQRYAAAPAVEITRLDRQWQRLRAGEAAGGFWLAATALSRAIGTAIGVMAILAPLVLFRRGHPWRGPLFGTWLVAAGFVGVYLPVHIELRYVVPIVPLLALLGVTAIAALRAGAVSREIGGNLPLQTTPPKAERPLETGHWHPVPEAHLPAGTR